MKDKVIWITGASSGIGAELAKQYSKTGARLILSARRKLALQAVKDSCENQKNIEILPLSAGNLGFRHYSVTKGKPVVKNWMWFDMHLNE